MHIKNVGMHTNNYERLKTKVYTFNVYIYSIITQTRKHAYIYDYIIIIEYLFKY